MTDRDRDRKRIQQSGERIIPSGMGGAGGGDLDDMGDDGYPENPRVSDRGLESQGDTTDTLTGDAATRDEYAREFQQAQAMTGARPRDQEIARQMGGGSNDFAPGIPQGDLSRDEVRNARDTARGIGGAPIGGGAGDSDPGAPWDDLDDGMRMRTPDNADLEPGAGDDTR